MTSKPKTTYKRKPKPKCDKPECHREQFEPFEDILFGEDDLAVPVVFPLSDGEKLQHAHRVFGPNRRTLDRKAKKFRHYLRTGKNSTMYVFMPAISAIMAGDWAAYRAMQRGEFDHDLVRAHAHRVHLREVELKEADVRKANEKAEREARRKRRPAMRLVAGRSD